MKNTIKKDLESLQNFFNENELPKIKPKPQTFLGIAKQPHYENVVSNIYAFFFDTFESHHFKDLFIKSLLELIQLNKPENKVALSHFSALNINTEYSTNNGGRIDLLLSNGEQAIIIENKVYHHLDNDLDDYWHSVNSTHKIGIILSLHPISQSNYAQYKNASNFISITHLQLLQQVQKNSGAYLLDANDKYLVFLKDFIQNMTNLSTTMMNEKEIEFYYKNQQKIRDTKAFLNDVEEHVKAEIEKAGNILNNVNLFSPRANSIMNDRIRYYVSKNNKDLMFTIGFDYLLTGENKLILIVELTNDALKNREHYKQINFTPEELEISFTENFLTTNYNWAHFAVKEYILEAKDIHNLTAFILQKIEDDHLLSIFKKIDKFLQQKIVINSN